VNASPALKTFAFNPDVDFHLRKLWYTYDRYPSDLEDVGDGETGPMLTGWPAFDIYSSPEDTIYIDDSGKFMGIELAQGEPEDLMGDWHGTNV
jgi:hypothetical protein